MSDSGDSGNQVPDTMWYRPAVWLWDQVISRYTPMSPAARREVVSSIWAPSLDKREYFQNYSILLILSIFIATFGMLQNSTAVVIGAMLIAPLMLPVLGVAAGIASGAPLHTFRQIVIVSISTGGGILLAWGITLLIPNVPGTLPDEVLSRTAPNLNDLLIALGAGVAGAYARVKPAVADAIPGVAIAVALVPPLAAVGITFEVGEWHQGLGALLLYLTNLVAIVLAGAITFFLTGLSPTRQLLQGKSVVVTGLRWALVAVLLVSVPLVITGRHTLQKATRAANVSNTVEIWLAEQEQNGNELEFLSQEVSTSGDSGTVTIFVTGEEEPGDVNGLAEDLTEELGKPISVTVRFIPFTEITSNDSEEP